MGSRKTFLFAIGIILVFSFCVHYSFASEVKKNKDEIEESYLIGFSNDVDVDSFMEKKNFKTKKQKKYKHQKTITMKLNKQEVTSLKSDPAVAFVEEDSEINILNAEENIQSIPWGIERIKSVEANNIGASGSGIRIAVIDTGIAPHPDLTIKGGESFIDSNTEYFDDNGHGTHVAGTIAALNNEFGVMGVAPLADIYSLKVLDSKGSGNYSQVINAIEWCIDNEINIISMSFGGNVPSEALHEAIKVAHSKGILLIASAGNGGLGTETETYPALFPEVISVGAIDTNNSRASFSSTGVQLDLVAPGVDIKSTTKDGLYSELSGTSMAAAHVSGAAAAIWSKYPTDTAMQISEKLLSSTDNLGDKIEFGNGLINLSIALGLGKENEIGEELSESERENFTFIQTMDNKLLAFSNTLQFLLEKAGPYNDIQSDIKIKSKELELKQIELKKLPNDLRNTEKISEESINNYYKNKENEFDSLIIDYQNIINNFIDVIYKQDNNEISIQNDVVWDSFEEDLKYNLSFDPYEEHAYIYLAFAPKITGTYNINLNPLIQYDDYDEVRKNPFFMALHSSPSYLSSILAASKCEYGHCDRGISAFLKKGVNYYLRVDTINQGQYVEADITASLQTNPLFLNSTVDVQLPKGQNIVYQFSIYEPAKYKIETGSYGMLGTNNDTYIELYSDKNLTQLISKDDDSGLHSFSSLEVTLGTGTYFIKLRPYSDSGTLSSRLLVRKSENNKIQYNYDQNNRLIGISNMGIDKAVYEYDLNGNLIWKSN